MRPTYRDVEKYVDKKFAGVSGFGCGRERHEIYGEITAEAMDAMLRFLDERKVPLHTFVDLGSGVGKMVVCMRLMGFRNSVGYEINPERHALAAKTIEGLHPVIRNGITLRNESLLNFESREPVVAYCSNLLLGDETNEKLFHRVVARLPSGSVFFSSLDTRVLPPNVHKWGELRVPQSWAADSPLLVHGVGQQ